MIMYVSTANGGPLNLRNAPSGSVIGTIPNGTKLEVTIDGDWAKTTYNNKEGYVKASYLISTKGSATVTKAQLEKIRDSLKSTLNTIEGVLK